MLRAERNLLSGAIPSEISNMTNLLALDLVYNKLTSNIPTSIGKNKEASNVLFCYEHSV
jgi:Leucine-rich repeat (LRR) protein